MMNDTNLEHHSEQLVELDDGWIKDFGYMDGEITIQDGSINQAGYCQLGSRCQKARRKIGYCQFEETDESAPENYDIFDVDFTIRAKQRLFKHVHHKRGLLSWAKTITVREEDIKSRPRIGVTYYFWTPEEDEKEEEEEGKQTDNDQDPKPRVCLIFPLFV